MHKVIFSLIAWWWFHTFVLCPFHTAYEDKHYLGSEYNRKMDKRDTDKESERKEGGDGGGGKKVAEKFKRKSSPLLKY